MTLYTLVGIIKKMISEHALERRTTMKKKINITIDGKLLSEIDIVAEELGMSRSSFLSMSAMTYVNQSNLMKNIPRMLDDYEKNIQLTQQENVSK